MDTIKIPDSGIVVDASCVGGNPGIVECRGVDLAAGEVVFFQYVGEATNNIGEWVAIALGANYICENKLKLPLYSDSKICIAWYYQKECRTNIFRDYPDLASKNKNLVGMLNEAMEIVEACRVELYFWDKRRFGENPADYGRKGKPYRYA